MRERGLSLAEVVVAIFLFVAGGLVCFELLLSACRDGARAQEVYQATVVAESVLDGVRNWAYHPDNYLNNWSVYDDKDLPWEGAFRVHTNVLTNRRNPVSPSTALAVASIQRELKDSSRLVKVKVSWRSGGPSDNVTMLAMINEPPRNVRASNPVVVSRLSPVVDPVVVNTTARFEAELFDSSDRPIKGVAWDWKMVPDWNGGAGGVGSLQVVTSEAMGAQIDLLHHYYRGDPANPLPPEKIPGPLVMRASCVYDGIPYSADSVTVTLGP